MAGGDTGIQLFDAWRGAADSAFDLAASSFELSMGSARAAMSVWQDALGGNAKETRKAADADRKTDAEPRLMGGSGDVPRPAVRSWYRAPYRSPFDPMFWLDPTSMADSTPTVLPGLWPTSPMIASPAGALEMWKMSVRLWPMMEMSMRTMAASDSVMRNMSAMMHAGPALQARLLDPVPAVTSYRSAGGHAVTQIAGGNAEVGRAAMPSGSETASGESDSGVPITWPGHVAFELLKLWMPKNGLPA
ncbi:MAG: hypothetical protein AB7G35_19540 [Hyphomicrobiaceae bacterium]